MICDGGILNVGGKNNAGVLFDLNDDAIFEGKG